MSQRIKKFGSDANNKIYVRLDTDNLEKIEAMLNRHYVAQIGVLGEKAAGRQSIDTSTKKSKGESSLSNADIGLIHEKGSPPRNIPRRSFLEVPLTTKMPVTMAKVGAMLLKGLNEFNIETAYKNLAAIGEGIVKQAFPTSGYGTWPDLGRGKMSRDVKTGKMEHEVRTGPSKLTDTGQLAQSISSRVISK